MLTADQLRAYATRLMVLSLRAVAEGDEAFADRLVARASHWLERAYAIEPRPELQNDTDR